MVAGTGIVWKLPGNLGREYAAVSGDHNPIHLYPLSAKAFGFKRQIAHGMWTKARSVAAFANRLPDAGDGRGGVQEADLPARARWRSGRASSTDGLDFSLTSPEQRRPAPRRPRATRLRLEPGSAAASAVVRGTFVSRPARLGHGAQVEASRSRGARRPGR